MENTPKCELCGLGFSADYPNQGTHRDYHAPKCPIEDTPKYPPLVRESRKALADELRGMAESVRTMEAEDIGQQWADSQESSDRCVW